MTVRLRAARELDRLLRASEHVVVGDGDGAEPDLLCRVEQFRRGDAAVVRPGRVGVEVDRDPLAIGQRVAVDADLTPPARQPPVEPIELAGDLREVVGRGARSRSRSRFEGEPLAAFWRGHELARLVEQGGAVLRGRLRPDVHTASEAQRDVRLAGERALPDEHDLPAVAPVEAANRLPRRFALAGDELDDDLPPLPGRAEERPVDPRRDHRVVAGEALGRRLRRLLGCGEQRVDPAEQPRALRLARREEEAVRREERRDGERVRVAQREVREARQPRLEAVDDVERAVGECEREVRADADGRGHRAAAGDGQCGADRDHVAELAPLQRAPARAEVGGAVGRRQHGDGVAESPQLAGDAGDVVVHVVRLRPGERRDEADSEAHRLPSLVSAALRRRQPQDRVTCRELRCWALHDWSRPPCR